MGSTVARGEWEWFGQAGHFICSRWCRFHLCTKVGPWLVSTVGEYVHPRHSGGREDAEAAWLKRNWPGEDIGPNRKYETMVFLSGVPCASPDCGCGLPAIDGSEVECVGYNTAKDARAGHLALCNKWASAPLPSPEVKP